MGGKPTGLAARKPVQGSAFPPICNNPYARALHLAAIKDDWTMRTIKRPRRYLSRHWLGLLRPALRYSVSRDAYILRGVGNRIGPVVRLDRRLAGSRGGRVEGVERRRTSVA